MHHSFYFCSLFLRPFFFNWLVLSRKALRIPGWIFFSSRSRYVTGLIIFNLLILGARAEAPPLQLANVYSGQIQLADYWVSEKLDGVRAYWDGKHLVSRQGNIFKCPPWFTQGFPSSPLDGELWLGRGTFDRLSGVVRQQSPDEPSWRQVRYMVFDAPAANVIFEQRLKHLQELVRQANSPYLQAVEQFKLADHAALMTQLDQVVKGKGEGLMLHRGTALYRAARTDDLLKVKTYEDAEAVVLAYLPGKGKYQGMMGALLVETPDQRRFKIGTGFSDLERKNPPPIGSTITYKFFGTTSKNIPRFASFLRVRDQNI